MAERLSNLAIVQNMAGATNQDMNASNFNPRQVSLSIRSPEDLAAFNQFLVTLGRDIVVGSDQLPSGHPSSHTNSPDSFSPQSLFDETNLSHLGLTGLPGLPLPSSQSLNPGNSYSSNPPSSFHHSNFPSSHTMARSAHSSLQSAQFNSLYPTMNDHGVSYPSTDYSSTRRPPTLPTLAKLNPTLSSQYHHATPPLESSSPLSSASTPSSSTPPQISLPIPDNAASFDYLRPSHGQTPVAHLAPNDYMSKSIRTTIPLKSLPGSIAHLAEPAPVTPVASRSGPPARSTLLAEETEPQQGPLYPLLTQGDSQYKLPPLQDFRSARGGDMDVTTSPPPHKQIKLPPLNQMYPPRSAVGSLLSTRSGDSTPTMGDSPDPPRTSLPRLVELDATDAMSTSSETEITGEVAGIGLDGRGREITARQRRRHAELILGLLVSVNEDYKKRYGNVASHASPPPAVAVPPASRSTSGKKLLFEDEPQDVEMTAV
jgi:hypothetical protein